MTITINPVRNQYDAISGQTVFNYTFKIYSSTDINVYLTPAGQTPDDSTDLITGYIVDPNTLEDESGGFLTLNNATSAGETLTIVSAIPYNRETDYQFNGDFRPITVNNDLDRVVSLVKQNQGDIQRAVLLPESGEGTGLTLPEPSEGEGIKWESGDLVNTPITETVSTDSTEYKLVAVTGNDVKVRGLKQGQNVVLSDDGTNITIKASVTGGGGDVNTSANNTYDEGTVQDFTAAELRSSSDWRYVKIPDILLNGTVGNTDILNQYVLDSSSTKGTSGYEIEVQFEIERTGFTGDPVVSFSIEIGGFNFGETIRARVQDVSISTPNINTPTDKSDPYPQGVVSTSCSFELINGIPAVYKGRISRYSNNGPLSDITAKLVVTNFANPVVDMSIRSITLKYRKVPGTFYSGFEV